MDTDTLKPSLPEWGELENWGNYPHNLNKQRPLIFVLVTWIFQVNV